MITAVFLCLIQPALRWCDVPKPGHSVPRPAIVDAPKQPWGQRQRRTFRAPINFYAR